MSYTSKTHVLDWNEDSVSIQLLDSQWDGMLKFELEVWRKLRNGNHEQIKYVFKLDPESTACVRRSLKRALQESVDTMKNRIYDLEAEL